MQSVLRPYIVDIDEVEEQGNNPVSCNWEEEGEVEVGDVWGEWLDWREAVWRKWRKIVDNGIVVHDNIRHSLKWCFYWQLSWCARRSVIREGARS